MVFIKSVDLKLVIVMTIRREQDNFIKKSQSEILKNSLNSLLKSFDLNTGFLKTKKICQVVNGFYSEQFFTIAPQQKWLMAMQSN